MSVHSLSDRRQRDRDAAESVFLEVEREIRTTRNEIVKRAISRLAQVDGRATLEPTLGRLGRIWADAWPLYVDSKQKMPAGGGDR